MSSESNHAVLRKAHKRANVIGGLILAAFWISVLAISLGLWK